MIARIRSQTPVRHYLREWRLKKGKTQQQLADLLDTEKGQVSNWENNKRGMTMEVQAAIAYALGIEPQDLFRDPEQPSADELLRRASPALRQQAFAVIETLLMTGTDFRLYSIEDEQPASPPVAKTRGGRGEAQ